MTGFCIAKTIDRCLVIQFDSLTESHHTNILNYQCVLIAYQIGQSAIDQFAFER